MDRPADPPLGRWTVLLTAALVVAAIGCASAPGRVADPGELEEGVEILTRPLPGDLAAVYRMRVSASGDLRLSIVTAGGDGRMTISEPFGGAVSLAAWIGERRSVVFDMEAGCRRDHADLRQVLGIRALPLAQAALLLGGRLPVAAGDEVLVEGGAIEIHGDRWSARARIERDPWRVVEVAELDSPPGGGWLIELDEHSSSVPGRIRVTNADGRWAELDLSRMEWPDGTTLPELPDFPPCGG